jgi:hypothetical protein
MKSVSLSPAYELPVVCCANVHIELEGTAKEGKACKILQILQSSNL